MNALQPDEVRLLAEVGFLAAAQADMKSAKKIFDALALCRPEAAFPHVGMAMTQLNRGRSQDAVRTLDAALTSVCAEDVPEVKAVRAFALRVAGRMSEAERAAREVSHHPLAAEILRQAGSQPAVPSATEFLD